MIARELLWKAWPAGYVARRGVATVGGWLCTHTTGWAAVFRQHNDPHEACIRRDEVNDSVTDTLRSQGEFLPSVDPGDTATWACLLADLAGATNARLEREGSRVRLWGARGLLFEDASGDGRAWRLTGAGGNYHVWIFEPPELHPAGALSHARIYERNLEIKPC